MWKPTADRILVRFDELKESTTAGGIVLVVDVVDDKYREATVLAIGRDVKEIVVGDRLLLSGYSGTSVGGDGDERIISEPEAWGVLAND